MTTKTIFKYKRIMFSKHESKCGCIFCSVMKNKRYALNVKTIFGNFSAFRFRNSIFILILHTKTLKIVLPTFNKYTPKLIAKSIIDTDRRKS